MTDLSNVVEEHFSTKNKSQFTISQDELRSILTDKNVVGTPVTRTLDSADGIRYVREVTLDKPIGTDKFSNFNPTSTMTILTDSHGNLITVCHE
ncbi:filamentous hemagglutinin [Paenibacillus terrae HPL-003]|uniref:Filamentous hemagglutinin n=1 Tax=Paenibacillus terrae (strain HPL-003) TaxID=985665 RepID=G7W1K3_PAETH|nr:filamentous hemagglutinin [Paenibacillus terrae HPL-003]